MKLTEVKTEALDFESSSLWTALQMEIEIKNAEIISQKCMHKCTNSLKESHVTGTPLDIIMLFTKFKLLKVSYLPS